ncbi:HAD family hydrolase [Rhodococcus marinonascens]|uniref:HAD family hydrolase n=1 Tax=Rhodococcus marinonascens TaxID=38311 RepID=UPI000A529711|nr:HAD family phosphatase [Rhodococcus marinonascens]
MSVQEFAPKAVVFDCDGLLMDTEPCWTVAETELFARRGLSFGAEQKALLIGRSLGDACVALAALFDDGMSPTALETELMGLAWDVVNRSADAMDGAHELVALIAEKVPVAVASNSPREFLDCALNRGGFSDVFPVSIAADEVISPKPAPEISPRADCSDTRHRKVLVSKTQVLACDQRKRRESIA